MLWYNVIGALCGFVELDAGHTVLVGKYGSPFIATHTTRCTRGICYYNPTLELLHNLNSVLVVSGVERPSHDALRNKHDLSGYSQCSFADAQQTSPCTTEHCMTSRAVPLRSAQARGLRMIKIPLKTLNLSHKNTAMTVCLADVIQIHEQEYLTMCTMDTLSTTTTRLHTPLPRAALHYFLVGTLPSPHPNNPEHFSPSRHFPSLLDLLSLPFPL